jgi:uncharacterized protein
MLIAEDTHRGKFYIHAYTPGEIRINNEKFDRSILLTPEQLIPWAPQDFSELLPKHFVSVIEFSPEVFLLGTGSRLRFPPAELLAQVYKHQIGVEVMDTLAACRTYNLLMSENRRVAASLLIR